MFECCDRVSGGDLSLAFDCKTTLPGGGECTNEQECIENYRAGVQEIEELASSTVEEEEKDTNVLLIVSIVLIVVVCLMLCIYVSYSTRCFKYRLCRKKAKKE